MPGKNSASIKHWPEDERPRERLIKFGSNSLSDAHLLGILIGSGDRRAKKNAVDLSRDLLNQFGTLENLDQATVTEICQVKGIGSAKAAQIKAALEVGKRMASKPMSTKNKLKSSQAFVNQFSPFLKNLKKEIVKIVLLDPKLQYIKDLTISEGSLNASIVHPREVMIPAIRESAASFALIHNHPSGDPTPSQADFEITHRLNKTGKIVGIHMVDHIIIGGNEFFSFADEGLL
ncbi:MAG: DNA repair protein RadC [Nitrospina sp.]|jgi:DNA repair protein RadC|nr:DNA repair protein RadC [Nitrospina sp.]MBT5631510.1 DNA repair protein RadC [Nitrospina sp.]